jgi:hypothetical protein
MQTDSGFRHSPETRETAYAVWSAECGRSTRCVSDQMKIPQRTVDYWKRVDGWDRKAAEDLLAVAGPAVEVGKAEIALAIGAANTRLIKLLDHTKDERLAFDLVKYVHELNGLRIEGEGPRFQNLVDARTLVVGQSEPKALTTDDLRQAATLAIEANVVEAQEEQRQGRRKTW